MRILLILGLVMVVGLACQGWGGGGAINEAGEFSEAQFSDEQVRQKVIDVADSVITAKGYQPENMNRLIRENRASYEIRYRLDETGADRFLVYLEKKTYRVMQLVLQP